MWADLSLFHCPNTPGFSIVLLRETSLQLAAVLDYLGFDVKIKTDPMIKLIKKNSRTSPDYNVFIFRKYAPNTFYF